MYGSRVLCSFLKVILSLLFLEETFCIIQIGSNSTWIPKDVLKENYTASQNSFIEKNPITFRRQNFNENLEKIETMNNGTVLKSAFIPIVHEAVKNEHFNSMINTDNNRSSIDQTNLRTVANNSVIVSKENIINNKGKKYKIIKIKKIWNQSQDPINQNEIQRRNFSPLPNLLSLIPLKWMTKEKKVGEQSSKLEDETKRSKIPEINNEEENTAIKNELHQGEKIKKLLNLFTIVKFDNGECFVNGIDGTCLHKTECEERGGKYTASCAGQVGVCCHFEKTCGHTTSDSTTYFINEGFPDSSTIAPRVCTLTVNKASPEVQQIRLDFQIFQLRDPTNGTCLHDRLLVTGHDMNYVIPEICGDNTGQHLYIDLQDSNGPITLNIVTMGEYFPRNFRVKMTQIKAGQELLAPQNCLQYYAEPNGYVKSFNYQHDENENLDAIVNGYFNNLNYAICIKKNKDFCSISYENEETEAPIPAFQLVNVDEDGERLLPSRQAGVETFDCPDDYLIINGMRLCGEKLNDASVELDYTRNYPVTDTTNGPFIVVFRTDGTITGRGFNLRYTQHPCPT